MATTTYDTIGVGYASVRRPDPSLRSAIEDALGDAATIINIGAGAGSYEPYPRCIAAIEPSQAMIRQRQSGIAPAIQAEAEALPLSDQCVDAAMALHTVHHWTDLGRGLAEMRRVARRVLVLTVDPDVAKNLWIVAD